MAQESNSLDALASILKLFQGSKSTSSTSGGTETTQTNLDQGTLAGLLKQALESNQGLAAVSQGQRSSGLYNSSTNRLLSNDLLARLTANTAAAGASKTVTKSPTVRTDAVPGQGDMLSKLLLGMSAYQKLGGTKALKEGAAGLQGLLGIGMTDMNGFANADAAPNVSNAFADAAGFTGQSNDIFSSSLPLSTDLGSTGDLFSFNFSGAPSADFSGSDSGASVNTGVPVEDTNANFPSAPSGSPSSSEILEGAKSPSADTTSVSAPSVNAASAGSSLFSLGMGISQLTDSSNKNNAAGAVNTATGAYGTYKAADALASGSSLDFSASAGSGSALGYIGPALSAINAERNPEGIQGKDYRHAVGSAVLNYFGWGWAAPIVHQVAQPVLDAAMDAGAESGGMAGAFVADPVGSLISGEYEPKDMVQAVLDPGNIFGGNPGGSIGSVAAYGIDPVGAALGDKGLFGVVKDSVNSVDKAIGGALGAPGRVVCTELALGGELPIEKYNKVIQPAVTLKGRVLLGYHLLGVPAVKRLRADKKFRARALPYVNAYLDHKLGKHNWRGFLIKWIGEPLCWCLSFFNRDPDYYQTLYPYRRVRNG